MQKRHKDRKQYFEELAKTCERYYLDYLEKYKTLEDNSAILEIGCGEGGNLYPFACKNTTFELVGMDLNKEKTDFGKSYFAEKGLKAELDCLDFFEYKTDKKFDLILIHDVIEHIPPQLKEDFFLRVKNLLKDDGVVFFGFPAWQMPFGGHQQIASSFVSKIPFVHLLPKSLFVFLLKLAKEDKACTEELLNVRQARMPIEKFEKIYRKTGFKLVNRRLWFINPHYEQKFGLKPRKQLKAISCLPWIRNFATTSCFYILGK